MRTSRLINQRSSRSPGGRLRATQKPTAAARRRRRVATTPGASHPTRPHFRSLRFASSRELRRPHTSNARRASRERDSGPPPRRPRSSTTTLILPAIHRRLHVLLGRRRERPSSAAVGRRRRRRRSRGVRHHRVVALREDSRRRVALAARVSASPRSEESRGIGRSHDRRDDATTDGARKAAPFPRASPLRTSSLTALLLDRSPPSQR